MGKGKLAKFADMERYENVFQCPFSAIEYQKTNKPTDDTVMTTETPQSMLSGWSFELYGRWRERYFKNDNPIVLELGCGKGEYAVELARKYPEKNFIGVDIKGARMWTGATKALEAGLTNVAFLRTNIEIIDHFFAPDEVQELWLTFSDPQMKNPRKRLTSTYFMERYRHFLVDGGMIHLKTDSNFLYTYTTLMIGKNQLPVDCQTDDLYARNGELSRLSGVPDQSAGQQHATAAEDNPFAEAAGTQTYYEGMWLERGLSIKYVRWRLPHAGTLEEPDVEIELDDYRSYHRTKRSSLDKAR
jgi:tRNA (guanine-N7-)-methyltransferase